MTAKDIYENCRSWLQFAETKNGFALAFCGALIAAETALLPSVEGQFKPYVVASMLIITLGAICSLLSFVPQETVRTSRSRRKAASSYGIVYFGHIAQRDAANFIARAKELLGLPDSDVMSVELLKQCHTLAVITVRKLRLFYASVIIAGLSIIAPLLAAGIRWLCT